MMTSPTHGESGAGHTVELVGDADLDGVEVGEDVELGEADGVVVVDGVGVAHLGDIEPAAAAGAT